jgi:hypothetical protein
VRFAFCLVWIVVVDLDVIWETSHVSRSSLSLTHKTLNSPLVAFQQASDLVPWKFPTQVLTVTAFLRDVGEMEFLIVLSLAVVMPNAVWLFFVSPVHWDKS